MTKNTVVSVYSITLSQTANSSYCITELIQNSVFSAYTTVSSQQHLSSYTVVLTQQCVSDYTSTSQCTKYSVYSILTSKYKTIASEYTYTVTKAFTFPYSVRVAQTVSAEYTTLAEQHNYSTYNTTLHVDIKSSFCTTTQQHISSIYTNPVSKKVYGEYFIQEIKHTTVEWQFPYTISNTDLISCTVEGRYEISLEGLSASSSRALLTSSTATYITDRKVSPQTYVTHSGERQIVYAAFSTITASRNTLAQNFAPYTETKATTTSIIRSTSRRQVAFRCIKAFTHYSKKIAVTAALERNSTVRFARCVGIEPFAQSERQCICLCTYTTGRYIALKVWYATERPCTTCGIPYTPKAEQRHCWAQVSYSKYEVIRTCYTEGYAVKTTLVINTHYTHIKSAESSASVTHYVELFSGTVTDEALSVTQVRIDTAYNDTDLIIVEPDGTNYNLALEPFVSLHTVPISQNIVSVAGYIVPVQQVTYLRFRFVFLYQDAYPDPNDYYNFLLRHGYIKLQLEGEEIYDEQAITLVHVPLTPIPFRISLYKQIAPTTELEVVWGYPYITVSAYRAFLMFST